MNKLEAQMIRVMKRALAIGPLKAGKNAAWEEWPSDNTNVQHTPLDGIVVRLHGNEIARIEFDQAGVPHLHFTLAGWNTRTTRSRVNAILLAFSKTGDGVYAMKGIPHYAGNPIDASDWYVAAMK